MDLRVASAFKKITAQDVAKAAGVSQSAVSRCFTSGASVSVKTAEKIRAAANQLGYRPNILARSLITGNSRIIGVVVAYLNNQFYPEALEILSNKLRAKGYHLLIFMAKNEENIDAVMEEIMDYQVDGLILASVAMSSELTERCREAGIPAVLFNRHQAKASLPAVTSNNYQGGCKVAELFLQRDFKRIGYIAGWEQASTQKEREQGFVDTLHAAGVELSTREVGNFNQADTITATRAMFTKQDYPDAVFVANDHMAFATMGVLEKELGLRIPQDVSIMGFDDVPLAAWPNFNLSTVRQHANAMVEETIRILLSPDTTATSTTHIQFDCDLVLRNTIKNSEEL